MKSVLRSSLSFILALVIATGSASRSLANPCPTGTSACDPEIVGTWDTVTSAFDRVASLAHSTASQFGGFFGGLFSGIFGFFGFGNSSNEVTIHWNNDLASAARPYETGIRGDYASAVRPDERSGDVSRANTSSTEQKSDFTNTGSVFAAAQASVPIPQSGDSYM